MSCQWTSIAKRAEEEARQAADGEEEEERQERTASAMPSQIEPLYIVATQLKTFTPLGMATRNVSAEKIIVANSLMPATNMWCPQTRNPRSARPG